MAIVVVVSAVPLMFSTTEGFLGNYRMTFDVVVWRSTSARGQTGGGAFLFFHISELSRKPVLVVTLVLLVNVSVVEKGTYSM